MPLHMLRYVWELTSFLKAESHQRFAVESLRIITASPTNDKYLENTNKWKKFTIGRIDKFGNK